MQLTDRDHDILTTLTWKARLLDNEQLATTWWHAGRSGRIEASRRAGRLVASGLLKKLIVLSRPLPRLDAPIIVYYPGGEEANLARAAHLLHRRWSQPPRSTTVYLATPRAAALTGGRASGLKHPLQASHDLAVTQVYLNTRKRDPDLAIAWLGEDCVPWAPGRRVRRADAVIPGAAGGIALAIEIGGSGSAYGRKRLEALHRHFAKSGIPYVLW